jgi:hypothetical protein
MSTRRHSTQTLLGGLVVLLGLVLLARTTGVYDTGVLLRYVPSLFVLLGVYALVSSGFRNVVGSLVVVLVAGAWQLVALDLLQPDEVFSLWPLLVVLFGLSLVLGRYRAARVPREVAYPSTLAVFGGREDRATSKQFRGADLTALFGGVELDLRDAAVADPPATVNATALFGGVELIVPRDWNVRMDVLPVLGGAADERARGESDHESVDLVVTGLAAFGGVSVTD